MQPQGLADTGTSHARALLSVVVPMRNEVDNVAPLMARLMPVLNNITSHWEILCVDDGSTDETWERILQAEAQDSRIIGLKLSRGFGHQYALLAGLSCAQGAAVVTMDGDLQHPPELIAQLVALWRAGFAIVTTQRQEARSTGTFKRFTSRYFLRLFSFFATVFQRVAQSSDSSTTVWSRFYSGFKIRTCFCAGQ
jgi:dolichol-phosphate mannosyltransferase